MGLSHIRIHNVRNIRQQSIEFSPGLNLIEGDNGSGKTSLLESIFLLGRAKSFRTQSVHKIITQNEDQLNVFGRIESQGLQNHLGVQKTSRATEIRINGQTCTKTSDLVSRFPIQLIRPESHSLLDGIPQIRRSFLDWGLFHVKHTYLSGYKKYNRALHQRNALLKQGRTHGLSTWNRELVEYGTILSDARSAYLTTLKPIFLNIASEFLGLRDIKLVYQKGWDQGQTLEQALDANSNSDLQRGYTWAGPHRGELLIKQGNMLAKDRLSRGQSKLLVMCLNLAQIVLFNQQTNHQAVVLMDDLSAELDLVHQELALKKLAQLQSQVFVTSTKSNSVPADAGWLDVKMFHVKQGEFKEKAQVAV